MTDTPHSLADRLREEGGRVVEFFKSLSEEQWGLYVYQNGEDWTMHQLLAHFVSAEIGRKELIKDILSGGKGAPAGFEIDAFNHREVEDLSAKSNESLLELFSRERADLVTVISDLAIADLGKIGNDPFLGEVPLLDMIKLTYRHLQIHLRDARRCL
jgi:hypothetical protein